MKYVLALLGFVALASCGADGDPVQPSVFTSVGVGTGGAYGGVTLGFPNTSVGVSVGGCSYCGW